MEDGTEDGTDGGTECGMEDGRTVDGAGGDTRAGLTVGGGPTTMTTNRWEKIITTVLIRIRYQVKNQKNVNVKCEMQRKITVSQKRK